MRECRKCGANVPNNMQIDGKRRSLQNRKFCLQCSPFGGHNTRSDDPDKAPMPKHQRKYSSARKEVITLSLYKRALTRKSDLINSKGGKCQICDYDKCSRALSFHHRDSETKKFGLTLNNLWSKPWDDIQAEAEKCDLLCANCHMEIEDAKSDIVDRVNTKYGTVFNQAIAEAHSR